MLLIALAAVFTALPGFSANQYASPPVRLYIHAVLMPYITNTSYAETASNLVEQIYASGAPSGELGHKLQAAYVAQPANGYTSNTMWFTIQAVAKDPGYKFLPGNCLTFTKTSTDGLLAGTNTFASTSYYYNSAAMGIIWGPGENHRIANTIAAEWWNQTPVNEFIFVGAAGKFFLFNDSYTFADVNNYIWSFPTNYQVTGTWTFNDGVNVPVHASKTLHTRQGPSNGLLGDEVLTNAVSVAVGLRTSTNDTWTLQFSPTIDPPSWIDQDTMNGGDIFSRPATSQGFWRTVLQ